MKLKNILIAAMIVSSATVFSQARLTLAHKKVKGTEWVLTQAASDAIVKIDWYSTYDAEPFSVTKKQAKKGLFELTNKGQKAFIESMSTKSADAAKFVEGLKKNLTEIKTTKKYDVRKTTYLKKIEIDVQDVFLRNKGKGKGRLDELVIRITLPNTDIIKFKSLKNITTKYDVIDFGEIGLTRNQSFTANVGFDFAGTGSVVSNGNTTTTKQVVIDRDTMDVVDSGGNEISNGSSNASNIGASYSAGRTVTENRQVKERRIALKGTVGVNEIMIYQQGAPGINLNDKIILEVVFEVTQQESDLEFRISGFRDKKGEPVTDVAKQKLTPYFLTKRSGAIANTEIDVNLSYDYVYREVANFKGKRSPGEWDDKVKYHILNQGTLSSTQKFLKKGEIRYDAWVLLDPVSNKHIAIDFYGTSESLEFFSLGEAQDFLVWLLQTKSVTYKGMKLLIGDAAGYVDLKPGDIANLKSRKL